MVSDHQVFQRPAPTRALAFFVRAFAAAREALTAMARRSCAVSFLAVASPPRRPISDRYLEISRLSIADETITPAVVKLSFLREMPAFQLDNLLAAVNTR